MQGSRAWLRLRRAWGVVSTGLCRRINQQLRRLQREENPDRGQRVRAEVLGQLGIALQPWEKLCPLGFVPRESSAGLAEVWERGGQSFAGLCHILAVSHIAQTGQGSAEMGMQSGAAPLARTRASLCSQ